jgi:membrane AbrB-like protein
MTFVARRHIGLLVLYPSGICAGWLFSRIGVPLPWMIGPLLLTAAAYVSGFATAPVPVRTRPFGQMAVAAQVGLAFSPAAFSAVIVLAPLLIGMAVLSALCALATGIGLARITQMRLPQAILSTFPTSPVEAAVMAEKLNCDPAPVILSQTVRIASIVVLVPISVYAIDGWPDRSVAPTGAQADLLSIGALALLAVTGAVLFRSLKLSNPYFLGPLAFSAAMTAAGFELASFPRELLAAAQIVLGTWLGSTFRKDLFAEGGRIAFASTCSAVVLLALVSTCAVGLAHFSGQSWEVLVLGAAPGGVTEMALTARFLGVDLALVTAFQLTRIFLFMPNIPWIISLIDRHETKRGR